jgi:ParB/RepB/Spo0J family partition protein
LISGWISENFLHSEIPEIWKKPGRTALLAPTENNGIGKMTTQDTRALKGPPSFGRWTLRLIKEVKPDPHNPRKHSPTQVRAIAKAIEAFGFNAPILVDSNGTIVAGHGRYAAAEVLGLEQIPVVVLEHLSDSQARAYMLADNKLNDRSSWDEAALARRLKELSELALDFEITAIGFERPNIDLRIRSLDATPKDDDFEVAAGPAVSKVGDLWLMDSHRLHCADALDADAYNTVLAGEKAVTAFADRRFDPAVDDHAPGKLEVTEREFSMPPVSAVDPTSVLKRILGHLSVNCHEGAFLYGFSDWRRMGEILASASDVGLDLVDLCVWTKDNVGKGAMSTPYRAQHELIFVFKNGHASSVNSVRRGRSGRVRSNVWNYPVVDSRRRKKGRPRLDLPPNAKPVELVADAILDCTAPGDIVFDPFVSNGTAFVAAERTGRRCYGIEFDPRYVDAAIRRWQRLTGRVARNGQGQAFDQVSIQRRGGQ